MMPQNLIAEKRVDKNGKTSTKWVKPSGSASSSSLFPAPAVTPQKTDDPDSTIITSILGKFLDEEQVEGYTAYLARRSEKTKAMFAQTLSTHQSEVDVHVAVAMINDHGHSPKLMQLMMDDFDFTKAVAEAAGQNSARGISGKYSNGLGIISEAFTKRFRQRSNELPEDFDERKYGPIFRASVVTRLLDIDDSAPTEFDEYEQIATVRDEMDTFMPHLAACRGAGRILNHLNVQPTLEHMRALCQLLEDYPGTDKIAEQAMLERKRFDLDELRGIISSPSSSLSEGVL